MTLNAKLANFMDFLAISGCDTSLYHSQEGATVLSLYYHYKSTKHQFIHLLTATCNE